MAKKRQELKKYEDAKNEQAFVEGRIQSLTAIIKNAVIIDEKHSRTFVQIGSTVTIEGDNGKEKYTIVGAAEAAPDEGRISNESPVGRALLGKKKGEGNVKSGNRFLAWAFIEAANFAVRYNARIRRYHQRKSARTNGIVAIKAVAHKLARACYYILRDRVSFDVDKAFA